MSDGSLIFDTQIDDTGISRFARTAGTSFGGLLKANVIGELVARGMEKAAQSTFELAKSSIILASDLTEVQNVVDTTFGKSADVVNSWAKSAAESFGMSELQAKQFNGTMGAMLKSMQLSDDEVLGMSTSLSGLAGDFASFYNLDTQEAFDKIRSGISGETEPLKQLGINMSVANLEAYALSEGISKAYSEMTQAEQATLRYNYLMSASSDSQGDFAKTSDSLANQLRILKLNASDAAAEIGTDLMPMVQDGVSMLNGMVDDLSAAYQTGGMDGLASEMGNVLGKLVTEITNATPAIIEASVSVIENLVKSLGDNADTITQAVTVVMTNLIEGLTGMLPELIQATMNLAKGLAESIAKEAPELIPQVVSNVIDTITTVLTNDISDIVEAGMNLLDGLMQGLIKATPMLIEAVPDIIMKIAKAFVEGVGQLIISANEMAEQTSNAMSESMGEDTGMFNNIGVEIGGAILAGIFLGLEDFGEQWTAYWEKYGSEHYYKDIFGNEYGISDEMRKQQAEAEKALEEAQAELKTKNEETLTYMQGQSDKAMDIATTAITQVNAIFGNVENGLASIGEQATEAIAANTENLKTAWEQISHDYATGVISSDEELYQAKLAAWVKYGDESNKDHWQYYEDIKGMEQSFAADSIRQAEEKQEELTQQAEQAQQERLQNLKDTQKQELSSVKSTLSDIVSTYKQQYNAVLSEQKSYTDGIRSQLDLFKKEETDDKITYSLENLADYKKAVSAYTSSIKKLKERGVNDALLSEIQDAGMEDGTAYAKILLSKSDEELKELNDTYAEIDSMIEQSGKDMYGSQLDSINQNFVSEVSGLFGSLPAEIQGIGLESALAFAQGLNLSSGDAITQTEQFCDDLMTAISDGIDNGTVSAKGLTDNLIADFKAQTPDVLAAVSNMLNFDGLAAKVKAAVTAEISATSTAVAAGAGTKSYSKPEENQAQNSMKSFAAELNRMLSDINKPLNIYLDRDKLGNANISFANLKSRQTGRLVFT